MSKSPKTAAASATAYPTLPSSFHDIINKIIHNKWENVVPLIPKHSIDLLLTDPPFGMNFQSNVRKVKLKKIENDTNLDWLSYWCAEMYRVMKIDAHGYVFCSHHHIDVFKSELSKYFNVKNILIWEKNNAGQGDLLGDYAPKYEMILFLSNGTKKLNGFRDDNILKSKKTGNKLHPTQKPNYLMEYLIEKSSDKSQLVLDTFAGSFVTAKSAIATGRNYITCEMDKEYCDKAKKECASIPGKLF